MFGRGSETQNSVVAHQMRSFFRGLPQRKRAQPEEVAKAYGKFLYNKRGRTLDKARRLTRSRFYVSLSVDRTELASLTKRCLPVSDTLLLSHQGGSSHQLGRLRGDLIGNTSSVEYFAMHCPNLTELGRWLLDCEPLLRAGLSWYLPRYSTYEVITLHNHYATRAMRRGLSPVYANPPAGTPVVDYLIRDGRAVEASGATPLKNKLVRPVLEIDLPFIDGVSLRDYSAVTVQEFTAFSGFRNFLRLSLLEMDDALNAVQSEAALTRLGLRIEDEVRSLRAQMNQVKRRRAVGAAGAVVGTSAAILLAVYGPALTAAIPVLGAGGGIWQIIQAAAENSPRALREDKWYWVWAIAKRSDVSYP